MARLPGDEELDSGTPQQCWGLDNGAAMAEEEASRSSLEHAPFVLEMLAWMHEEGFTDDDGKFRPPRHWKPRHETRGRRYGAILERVVEAVVFGMDPSFDPGNLCWGDSPQNLFTRSGKKVE